MAHVTFLAKKKTHPRIYRTYRGSAQPISAPLSYNGNTNPAICTVYTVGNDLFTLLAEPIGEPNALGYSWARYVMYDHLYACVRNKGSQCPCGVTVPMLPQL
jgi:hypothetical protein